MTNGSIVSLEIAEPKRRDVVPMELQYSREVTPVWDDDWIPGFAYFGPEVLRNITGQFWIQSSPFGSVGGFPSLASIGGQFYVVSNAALTSMGGFSSLASSVRA